MPIDESTLQMFSLLLDEEADPAGRVSFESCHRRLGQAMAENLGDAYVLPATLPVDPGLGLEANDVEVKQRLRHENDPFLSIDETLRQLQVGT